MDGTMRTVSGFALAPLAFLVHRAAAQCMSFDPTQHMSLYTKSWLFTAWTLVVLLAFPYWLPFLEKPFGPFGSLVGIAFWLSHGVIALLCFTCPDCDLSAFQRRGGRLPGWSPWPSRICSRCGHDHSVKD